MDSKVLPSPDNYDRISGFRIYAVTCDDPGLGKPAFLAAKNAEFPVQQEVEALDYYIEHFVWGGLQRTTDESYPYGIYGIQDWKRNRTSDDPGRNGQLHLWRVYDYPHIVLMYYSMYPRRQELSRDRNPLYGRRVSRSGLRHGERDVHRADGDRKMVRLRDRVLQRAGDSGLDPRIWSARAGSDRPTRFAITGKRK